MMNQFHNEGRDGISDSIKFVIASIRPKRSALNASPCSNSCSSFIVILLLLLLSSFSLPSIDTTLYCAGLET